MKLLTYFALKYIFKPKMLSASEGLRPPRLPTGDLPVDPTSGLSPHYGTESTPLHFCGVQRNPYIIL